MRGRRWRINGSVSVLENPVRLRDRAPEGKPSYYSSRVLEIPEWILSIKLTAGKDRHHARVDQSVDQVETHAIKYAGSTPASGSSAIAPI